MQRLYGDGALCKDILVNLHTVRQHAHDIHMTVT